MSVSPDHLRATDDVEQITGRPAETDEQYVATNPDLFY
jgi:hypothetical protein